MPTGQGFESLQASTSNLHPRMKALTNPQGDAVTTRTQVPHDPEQVAHSRNQHNKELRRCRDGWTQDYTEDPLGATGVNEEAVDAYWNEQYDSYCRAFTKNSKLPVDLKPDALRNWIKSAKDAREKAKRYVKHLHELPGLEEFDFACIGDSRFGKVWINNVLAVAVATNGEVRIWLRKYFSEPVLHAIAIGDVPMLTDAPLVNYTARELFELLKALRIIAVAAPLDVDLDEETLVPSPV